MLCATELAIMNNADWCTLLSDDDREVLEYDTDIEVNSYNNIKVKYVTLILKLKLKTMILKQTNML